MSDAAYSAVLLAWGGPKPSKAPHGCVSAPRFARPCQLSCYKGCPFHPDEDFWPPLLPILVQPARRRDAAALSPSPGLSTSSPLPPQTDFQPRTSSYTLLPCCWRGRRRCQRCLQQEGLESTASILRIFSPSLYLFSTVFHVERSNLPRCVRAILIHVSTGAAAGECCVSRRK